jgi:predicted transcriptional regulator of viral defense system
MGRDEGLLALASRQHGVVEVGQLHALGLSPQSLSRMVARLRLVRLYRGVYAVGHTALTRPARELASVFACGAGARLSHRAAADRWGLLPTASSRIEVTAACARKPRDGIVVHRSRVLIPEDGAVVDGIPVTSVARTIVDLADVVRVERLMRALRQAEILGCSA